MKHRLPLRLQLLATLPPELHRNPWLARAGAAPVAGEPSLALRRAVHTWLVSIPEAVVVACRDALHHRGFVNVGSLTTIALLKAVRLEWGDITLESLWRLGGADALLPLAQTTLARHQDPA